MAKFSLQYLRTAAEFPALLMFFALGITSTTTHYFAISRSCHADFGYSQEECETLISGGSNNFTDQVEKDVQRYATDLLTAQELITQVAPAVIVLFLGPWSDTHGRKPVLTFNLTGFCLGGIVAIVVTSIDSLSAWYFTGCSLLIALFGGASPFITGIVCYISDITTEANRGFRMGIFEAVMAVGTLVGTVSTSYLFDAGGYILVFCLATGCFFLSFFFNVFVLVDSRQFNKVKKQSRLNVFSAKNFKDIVGTVFRRRNNNLTFLIILAILTSGIVRFVGHADVTVFLYFLMLQLKWDMEKYTLFKAVSGAVGIIGTIGTITLLHKKLKIREAPLIVATSALIFCAMLLQAWATEDWHIYLAAVIRCFGGIIAPMIRSLISKLVTQEEVGKLFAVTVALESLILLGGIPLYNRIYNATIDTNPGAFNFLSGGLYALLAVFAIISMFVQKSALGEDVFIEKSTPSDEVKTAPKEDKSIEVE